MAPALLPAGALLSYPWALLHSVETLTGYTALIQNPGMLKGGAHLIMFSLWLLGRRAGQVFYCTPKVGVLDPMETVTTSSLIL